MRYLIWLLLVLWVSCSCPEPEVITVERIVEVEPPPNPNEIAREARRISGLLRQAADGIRDLLSYNSAVIEPSFASTVHILCNDMEDFSDDLEAWGYWDFEEVIEKVTPQRLEEFFTPVRELMAYLDSGTMDISEELIRGSLEARLRFVELQEEAINVVLEQMQTFQETEESGE